MSKSIESRRLFSVVSRMHRDMHPTYHTAFYVIIDPTGMSCFASPCVLNSKPIAYNDNGISLTCH